MESPPSYRRDRRSAKTLNEFLTRTYAARRFMKPVEIWEILQTAIVDWQRHNAPRLGAAIAYYAIFSIAPLMVIAIAIAGSIFGEQAAKGEVFVQMNRFLGNESAARAIEDLVLNAARPRTGTLATTLSFFALWFGASGVFGQIKGALDTTWGVERKPGAGWLPVVLEYAWSVGMVAAVGLLLLASLVASSVLTAATNLAENTLPISDFSLRVVEWTVSLAVLTILFGMTFKLLPDVIVRWRDVWAGALITAILFSVGKFLIGWYLARLVVSSAYGAAGSFVLVLIWTYYSAQIFLLGAEVTQAYTRHLGVRVRPSWHAQFVTTTAADQPPVLPRRTVNGTGAKRERRGKSKRSGR
jgi:membrane protein